MDKCGICLKPAVQLFETGKEGVYACFKCQPLVPEVTIGDNVDQSQSDAVEVEIEVESGKNDDTLEVMNNGLYCGICDKTFAKNGQLQAHLRNHRAERRFVCMYCNKAFSQSNNLRAHLRIHTNERPYKCSECGKAFTQVTNLNNHVRLHTGERPFICPEPGCDKAYAQVTNLNQHRKRHLNGRLVDSYDCPVCGQSFQQRNHMYSHRREVHGESRASSRRFVCKLCDAVLASERQLHAHVAQHSNVPRTDTHAPHGEGEREGEREGEGEGKTELSCVFRSCSARFSTPHEHTEHLLQAHQLRVLTNTTPPQSKRGRPPKLSTLRPEVSLVDETSHIPSFDFVSVDKVKPLEVPITNRFAPLTLKPKNFRPIKIINATKFSSNIKLPGMQ